MVKRLIVQNKADSLLPDRIGEIASTIYAEGPVSRFCGQDGGESTVRGCNRSWFPDRKVADPSRAFSSTYLS